MKKAARRAAGSTAARAASASRDARHRSAPDRPTVRAAGLRAAKQPRAPRRKGAIPSCRARSAPADRRAVSRISPPPRVPPAPRVPARRSTPAGFRGAGAARAPRRLARRSRAGPSPRRRPYPRPSVERLCASHHALGANAPATTSHTRAMAAARVLDLRHTAPTVRVGAGLPNWRTVRPRCAP
jgi:hypothetical protein